MADTILVVEDDEDIAESVRDILECGGYVVQVAANGRVAIDMLERGRAPDVILLDLLMPIMDGIELLAELARRPALAGIPTIVMSAGANVAMPPDVAVIHKPFKIATLFEAVKHARA